MPYLCPFFFKNWRVSFVPVPISIFVSVLLKTTLMTHCGQGRRRKESKLVDFWVHERHDFHELGLNDVVVLEHGVSNSEDGLVEVKGWWEEERIGEFEINEYKNGFVSFGWGVVVKGELGARLSTWVSQGATKESLSL